MHWAVLGYYGAVVWIYNTPPIEIYQPMNTYICFHFHITATEVTLNHRDAVCLKPMILCYPLNNSTHKYFSKK